VDRAEMPKPDQLPISLRKLAFCHGTVVRADPDFHRDVDGVIASLEEYEHSRVASHRGDIVFVDLLTQGGDIHRIEFPITLSTGELIEELVACLRLPRVDANGDPVDWRLDDISRTGGVTFSPIDHPADFVKKASGVRLSLMRSVIAG
jgi:hypothetical protein